MNILIVDDDPLIGEVLSHAFVQLPEVGNVVLESDPIKALHSLASQAFDILLVDIFLDSEDHDGLWLCHQVRKSGSKVVIIVLTGIHSIEYLKKAFEVGVNEYLTKPFDRRELLIRSQRWFSSDVHVTKGVLKYYDLSYDLQTHRVFYRGVGLSLSKRNKQLLLVFLKSPETLFSQDHLISRYWGDLSYNPHRNLRSSIQSLRRSMGHECSHWIKTLPGEGYALQKPIDER